MRVVVVGAGVAGLRLAQRLRQRGMDGEVVLIGAEPHPPYDRPPLSKQVLRGECDLPVLLTPRELTDLSVDLRLGVIATSLDPTEHRLHTDAGPIDYDSLVIATGARALRVSGLGEASGGHVLRTWDDALAIRGRVRKGAVVAIIGAGLIGCEVAASARTLDAVVHLIDVADAPMKRVVGPRFAHYVAELHREHGVNLHLGTAAKVASDGRLAIDSETLLEPDLILHAVGARPEVAWLEGTVLFDTNGLACDAHGRTAAVDVFAIGDVAVWAGQRAEHWTSATRQADRVAARLLGQAAPSDDVHYWWSDQYDTKFQGLGSVEGADDVRVCHWGPNRRPIALFGCRGDLIGAVGMAAAGGLMPLAADICRGASIDVVEERFS